MQMRYDGERYANGFQMRSNRAFNGQFKTPIASFQGQRVVGVVGAGGEGEVFQP